MKSRRKLLRIVITILLCILALEVSPYIIYPLRSGTGFNRAEIRARLLSRDTLHADSVYMPPMHTFGYFQALHPFLGFSGDADKEPELAKEHGSAFDLHAAGDSSAFVVMFTGGSVADIFAAGQSEEMEREMQNWPELRAKKVTITSYAYPGYKQPQQLMGLLYFLSLGAKPDMVINIDGYNELMLPAQENIPAGVSPYFPRSWHIQSATAVSPDDIKLAGEIFSLREKATAKKKSFSNWLFRNSNFLLALWDGMDKDIQRRIEETNLKLRAQNEGKTLPFQSRGPSWNAVPDDSLSAEMVRYWAECSRLMHDQCRARGIRYLHFLQPNQHVPGSKPMNESEMQTALVRMGDDHRKRIAHWYPEMSGMGKRMQAEGLAFYDLTGIFRNVTAPLYVDACCHFNFEGNEIMKKEVVRIIRENL